MSYPFLNNIDKNYNYKKMVINIDLAKMSDVYNIRECNKKCLPIFYNINDYKKFISNDNYFIIVSKDHNEIAGYIMGIYNNDDDNLHIVSFAIDKLYRRRKIGTKLMDYIIYCTSNKFKDIKNITLNAMETNDAANIFYQKYGFKQFKLYKDYYSINSNAIAYIKNIEK
jgi:ribosomal protein S18 acetylase RimI-like enzyme